MVVRHGQSKAGLRRSMSPVQTQDLSGPRPLGHYDLVRDKESLLSIVHAYQAGKGLTG